MTPSQPRKAARRLARSSRSTCSMVRRSAAPSSAHRCAFLGSAAAPANRVESGFERSSRRHKRQPKTTRHVRDIPALLVGLRGGEETERTTEREGGRGGAGSDQRVPTCAAGGAPDGVPAGEEDLDNPRPDEAAGAGDAHDGGHRALSPGPFFFLLLSSGTGGAGAGGGCAAHGRPDG
jgi:hypothetical protein